MISDQITQWARDVGMMEKYQVFYACPPELQAFATLVRNATLEEAAAKCESLTVTDCNDSNVTRKECAKEIRSMKS